MMKQLLNYVPEMEGRLAREEALLREAPDARYLLHVDAGKARLVRIPAVQRSLTWSRQLDDGESLRILRVSAPEKGAALRSVEACGNDGSWFLLQPAVGAATAVAPDAPAKLVGDVAEPAFVTERVSNGEPMELYRGPDYDEAHAALDAVGEVTARTPDTRAPVDAVA